MDRSQSAEGRATGALFLIGFGSIWLSCLNSVNAGGVAIQRAGASDSDRAAFAAHGKGIANGLERGGASPSSGRFSHTVNIVQWSGVGAAVILLGIFHLPEFMVPAIATIVGLHLFPLARVFHYPIHYVTGTLLVLWS